MKLKKDENLEWRECVGAKHMKGVQRYLKLDRSWKNDFLDMQEHEGM